MRVVARCVLFLCAIACTSITARAALLVYGQTVEWHDFSANDEHTRRAMSATSTLWLVRIFANDNIERVCGQVVDVVATSVYLCRGLPSSAERARIAPYDAKFKFDAAVPVLDEDDWVVRALPEFEAWATTVCANVTRFVGIEATHARFLLIRASCGEAVTTQTLAENAYSLWISGAKTHTVVLNSQESRRLLLGDAPGPGFPPLSFMNGSGRVVLVSDSGLDWLHAAFYDPVNPVQIGSFAPNPHRKVVGIRSPISDYNALEAAHGTFASSNAVGAPVLSQCGVAHAAKLAFIDLSPNDNTLFLPISLDAMILDAFDTGGASVHSASWGVDNDGVYDDLSNRIDVLARSQRRMVHVVSAGNAAPQKVGSPATAKNVVSVGASYSRPEDQSTFNALFTYDTAASFSSRGPLRDGRAGPLVYALGVGVIGARAFATGHSNANHASYARVSGTSFAAPAIAGLAAGIQQRFAANNGGRLPDASLVFATLIAHAKRVVRVFPSSSPTPQTSFGVPVIDATRMIDVEGLVFNATKKRACFVIQRDLANDDSAPWRVALSWLDMQIHPGVSARALVNNLDMYVFSHATGELLGVGRDSLNPFEYVEISPPQSIAVHVVARQNVLTVDSVNAFQTYASVHIVGRALGVPQPCAGTCLPSEVETCAPTTQRRACDARTGTFAPSPCRLAVASNATCATGLVANANATACVCPTEPTAVLCENGALQMCASNAFAVCPLDVVAPPAPNTAALDTPRRFWYAIMGALAAYIAWM